MSAIHIADQFRDALKLARLMREEFTDNHLSDEAKQMVCSALARIWPEDRHTVETCRTCAEEGHTGCDECPTEARWQAADAVLDAYLSKLDADIALTAATPPSNEDVPNVTSIAVLARTWQIMPDLRWFAEYVQMPKRLQQARRCMETGEVKWDDVKSVYGPNAAI